jgi:hypothetical protein
MNKLVMNDQDLQSHQRNAVMSWLSVSDSSQENELEDLHRYTRDYPDTCNWIVKDKKISSWMKLGKDHPILWLMGNPGSGKYKQYRDYGIRTC